MDEKTQRNAEVSLDMAPLATDVQHVAERIEDGTNRGPSFSCDLHDPELVHEVAHELLPGLATACVDNTTGDVFQTPSSVAVDVRKEMMEYLTQRSENFVAESVILESENEAENSDHPCEIISAFIDEFTSSKRNLFSRVSGWLLSEKREDKIDEFQQEMELNGFWPMERREPISQTLLKNVDLKNVYHCKTTLSSAEELAEHARNCSFRTISCTNEGCPAKFIAAHLEKHDSVCPYKTLPCEQSCPATVTRRDMDRHCITDCPLKLVNCPFYSVGCQSTMPYSTLEQHYSENLRSHLLCVLHGLHNGASAKDLERRLEQIEMISSFSQLAEAQSARALTYVVKNLDAELGPLEINSEDKENEDRNPADKAGEKAKNEERVNEEASAANKAIKEGNVTDRTNKQDGASGKATEEVNDTNKAC